MAKKIKSNQVKEVKTEIETPVKEEVKTEVETPVREEVVVGGVTKNHNSTFSVVSYVILAVVVALVSSLATLVIVKKFGSKSNNVTGSWYNSYAGQTFVLTLNKDKTFEYGYEESEKTTGKYTNTIDVITLKTDAGETNLVYTMTDTYIEIDSTKYYNTKENATKNDSFYYIPEDYDTSMFTAITPSEFVKKFNDGETAFVMFARGSCGYCQQFRPIAAQSVKDYNYTLYYLNTTQLTDEDVNTISALDSKLDSITSTPAVYYIKGKKVADVQAGYTDLSTYGSFLTKNGVKKK